MLTATWLTSKIGEFGGGEYLDWEVSKIIKNDLKWTHPELTSTQRDEAVFHLMYSFRAEKANFLQPDPEFPHANIFRPFLQGKYCDEKGNFHPISWTPSSDSVLPEVFARVFSKGKNLLYMVVMHSKRKLADIYQANCFAPDERKPSREVGAPSLAIVCSGGSMMMEKVKADMFKIANCTNSSLHFINDGEIKYSMYVKFHCRINFFSPFKYSLSILSLTSAYRSSAVVKGAFEAWHHRPTVPQFMEHAAFGIKTSENDTECVVLFKTLDDKAGKPEPTHHESIVCTITKNGCPSQCRIICSPFGTGCYQDRIKGSYEPIWYMKHDIAYDFFPSAGKIEPGLMLGPGTYRFSLDYDASLSQLLFKVEIAPEPSTYPKDNKFRRILEARAWNLPVYVDASDRSLKVNIDALPTAGNTYHLPTNFERELLPVEPGLTDRNEDAGEWNDIEGGEDDSMYRSDEDPEYLPDKKRARKR